MHFKPGDRVRVKAVHPIGHIRTPFYFRGKVGVIDHLAGHFPNPEELAYGRSGLPEVANYRVLFKNTDLWSEYDGNPEDGVCLEIYEHWLDIAPQEAL